MSAIKIDVHTWITNGAANASRWGHILVMFNSYVVDVHSCSFRHALSLSLDIPLSSQSPLWNLPSSSLPPPRLIMNLAAFLSMGQSRCLQSSFSWIKIDQLDVTCFIISLFNAQHVSILRSLRLVPQPAYGYHTTTAKPQRNTNTHRTRAIQPMK